MMLQLADHRQTAQASVRDRFGALWASRLAIAQTSIAAGLAWFVAHTLLDHSGAFFAPVAAVIALGIAPGHRLKRAIQMVVGVAVGIAVGDLLIAGIGSGTWQVALVVLLAISATVLLGGSALAVTQAGASAAIVATLVPPSSGIYTARVIDALIGGAVGILVLVLSPGNPVGTVRDAFRPVFAELAATLDDLTRALRSHDLDLAEAALGRVRAIDSADLANRLDIAQETVALGPLHWSSREELDEYTVAVTQLDLAVRDVRVLARSAIRLIELEPHSPAALAEGTRDLAGAIRCLEHELSRADHACDSTELATRAAEVATVAAHHTTNLSVNAVSAQIRSTATDIIRARGLDRAAAMELVRKTEMAA